MEHTHVGWIISDWRAAAWGGRLTELDYQQWYSQFALSDPAWIYLPPEQDLLAQVRALLKRRAHASPGELPLFGVPFAVKDNIDVAGWPTTAGCAAFQYMAARDAAVVRRLKLAGALVVGKTNMDQFATGLVGTRSPYGIVRSAFNEEYIAGGSSSGSGRVVTLGHVPFSLGTDTAGSGRVPAAFGNLVGLKPTRGAVSTSGVVPACRTLDCVSVFALTVEDAALVGEQIRGFDADDPYSRAAPWLDDAPGREAACVEDLRNVRLGILDTLEFFGDDLAEEAFFASVETLKAVGVHFTPLDSRPYRRLAELLYGGAWVAERALVAGPLLEDDDAMDPVVRQILTPARLLSAEQAYRSEYERAELARDIQRGLEGLDALFVPTTGTTYRVSDVQAEPLVTNARLGFYTNFTNLADLAAVSVPGHFRADGLPTGLTLLGPAFSDDHLLELAGWVQRLIGVPLGATGRRLPEVSRTLDTILPPSSKSAVLGSRPPMGTKIVVLGAHLSGFALNHQLTERGGWLSQATTTAPCYRLYLLPDQSPAKPGLLRVKSGGAAIAVEVWQLPVERFGEFVREIPAPLGMGSIELADGTWEKGFICEPWALEGAQDITRFGGFAAFQRSRG